MHELRFFIPGLVLIRSMIIFLILNLIFVIGTAVVHIIFANSDTLSSVLKNETATYLLSQFNLASENTVATWYSSLLLLVMAFLSLFAYFESHQRVADHSRFNLGWVAISAIFFLLSLDEIGSIHENAGNVSSLDIIGDQSWESVLAIPILLVVLYVLLFGWFNLRSYTRTYVLFIVGTLLFASVPFQEHIEMRMWAKEGYVEDWNRPIPFVLLEEGSELFGSLAYIAGVVYYLLRRSHGKTLEFSIKHEKIKWIMGSLILLSLFFVLIYFLLLNIKNADEGIAINWFPMAMAVLALINYSFSHRRQDAVVMLFCLAFGAYICSNFYTLLPWQEIKILRVIVQSMMVAGLVYYIYAISSSLRIASLRFAHILGGILILSSFVFEHPIVTILSYSGFLLNVLALARENMLFNSFRKGEA
jgi:hypothetical protein